MKISFDSLQKLVDIDELRNLKTQKPVQAKTRAPRPQVVWWHSLSCVCKHVSTAMTSTTHGQLPVIDETRPTKRILICQARWPAPRPKSITRSPTHYPVSACRSNYRERG